MHVIFNVLSDNVIFINIFFRYVMIQMILLSKKAVSNQEWSDTAFLLDLFI